MTAKQSVLHLVQNLPDSATLDQIAEEVELLRRLEAAEEEIAKGHYYTHEEVVAHFREGKPLPELVNRQAEKLELAE